MVQESKTITVTIRQPAGRLDKALVEAVGVSSSESSQVCLSGKVSFRRGEAAEAAKAGRKKLYPEPSERSRKSAFTEKATGFRINFLSPKGEEKIVRKDKGKDEKAEPLSRSRVQQLIKQGRVTHKGKPVLDPNHKTTAGETYTITLPPPEPATPQAQDIPLRIVYEDNDILVIDKPPGMVVHPAAGNRDRTLVNALLAHCKDSLSGIGGVARPGIVHRLDKDTSGLMVVAKNDAAHQALTRQFMERSITFGTKKNPPPLGGGKGGGCSPKTPKSIIIERTPLLTSPQGGRDPAHLGLSRVYQALVWGLPNPVAGGIEGAIGRHPKNRQKMAVVTRGGKPALTHYKVLKNYGLVSLVECRLATGRTHQIRVHMAHINHPVVGDPAYGRRKTSVPFKIDVEGQKRAVETFKRKTAISLAKNKTTSLGPSTAHLEAFQRQALHAAEIRFLHPRTGKPMSFKSPLPEDMIGLIKGLEARGATTLNMRNK